MRGIALAMVMVVALVGCGDDGATTRAHGRPAPTTTAAPITEVEEDRLVSLCATTVASRGGNAAACASIVADLIATVESGACGYSVASELLTIVLDPRRSGESEVDFDSRKRQEFNEATRGC